MSILDKKFLVTQELMDKHIILMSKFPEIKVGDKFKVTKVMTLPALAGKKAIEGIVEMISKDGFKVSINDRRISDTHWCLFTNQNNFIFIG